LDDIKKILIGLLVFALTSIIAYLFKMRQLYVSIPRLYNKSQLSSNGSLCEIRIFNRGNHPEEDVTVAFAPELSVELLATDNTELSVTENKLHIPRIHKLKDVSALLMVEGGVFEHSKITAFSSKAVAGRILKANEEVPYNWAILFTLGILFISIFPSFYYGLELYSDFKITSQAATEKNELNSLINAGWSNLSGYYKSPIRTSYTNKEFPVLIKKTFLDKSGVEYLNYEVVNKTGLSMVVYVDAKGYEDKMNPGIEYWASLETEPLTTRSGTVKLPKSNGVGSSLNVEFAIKSDDDFVYKLSYELKRQR
jgi:hypothetical protein